MCDKDYRKLRTRRYVAKDNIDISGKIMIDKGDEVNALKDGGFYYIDMGKKGVVKAPEKEFEEFFEIK